MPDVNEYQNEDEWMAVCVPKRMSEGEDNDQAVAACMAMWQEKDTPADEPMDEEKAVASFGGQVKAVKMDDGNVKLGGYLIRFTDAGSPDLEGDYFTKDTDFGDAVKSHGYFNHRLPVYFGEKSFEYKERLPDAEMTKDDVGVYAEIIIGARNEYERMLADLGYKGVLGWSSGTAPHLIDTKRVKNANEITRWILGLDASLTPRPAEPKNTVVSIKTFSALQVNDAQGGQVKSEAQQEPEQQKEIKKGVNEMENENDKLQDMLEQVAETAARKAVESIEPVKRTGTIVSVEKDESEIPFKSLAENAQAVKEFTLSYGAKIHPRLKYLRAVQGASEGVPVDGGILLDPTLVAEVIKPIHEEGMFSSGVSRLPVGDNSNSGWINGVDETSRATGSRWGGLRGYRLAEGDTVTKSKPKFRRINWELKKYGVLVYDTNELMKDAKQFSAVVEQGAREEISFMLNDDIMNGIGVAGPLGFMNSGALITVTRDTGAAVLGTDISAMWARLLPRSKANAAWYINPEVGPQLDKLFAVGSTAVLFPYAGYDPSRGVRTLYGKPVYETEFNAALNTTGDIVLADMSQYLLWEKGGVEMATSIHVEFLTDQEVIRFIYRCDGQSALASALTPYKGTATLSPFVVLGSAT